MARYIDARKIKLTGDVSYDNENNLFVTIEDVKRAISQTPTADVVEVETIKAWLYEIAINNVGYVIDGDFSNACEEIISRLDGLRSFAKEFTPKERGGEK